METITLSIKSAAFLAMEAFVITAVGAAVIVGLHQTAYYKIRQNKPFCVPMGRTHLPSRTI